jgi:flavorubredoxin
MTQFNPSNNKLEKMSVRSAKTKLSLPSHSRIHQKDSAEILERTIEVKQNQIDSTAGIFYSKGLTFIHASLLIGWLFTIKPNLAYREFAFRPATDLSGNIVILKPLDLPDGAMC